MAPPFCFSSSFRTSFWTFFLSWFRAYYISFKSNKKRSQKYRFGGNKQFPLFYLTASLRGNISHNRKPLQVKLTTEYFINLWCSCQHKHTTPHTCWPAAAWVLPRLVHTSRTLGGSGSAGSIILTVAYYVSMLFPGTHIEILFNLQNYLCQLHG